MENRKWLKRKYPESFERINDFFDDVFLSEFKRKKYKLALLNNDTTNVITYKKDSIIAFKRSNPINDENYPLHYCIAKCDKNLTSSGYHSFNLFEKDFTEIEK